MAVGCDVGVSGVRPSNEVCVAMVVEVSPEIEQLVFEVCRRPESQEVDLSQFSLVFVSARLYTPP